MIFCLHFTPPWLSRQWIIWWSFSTSNECYIMYFACIILLWSKQHLYRGCKEWLSLRRTCKEQQLWIPVFAERLIFANLSKLQFCMELFEKLPTSLSRQKVYRISLFHIQTSKPFFWQYHYPWVILFDLQAVYSQWNECFFYWASYLLLLLRPVHRKIVSL